MPSIEETKKQITEKQKVREERERKQARKKYRKWFNSLSQETRAKLAALGLSPDADKNTITRRVDDSFTVK